MSKLDNVGVQPKNEGYERKKAHYQSFETAVAYDEARWSSFGRNRSNKRKSAAINRAISAAVSIDVPIRDALDIPCGTGRIFPLLADRNIMVTGADLSLEMMQVAESKFGGSPNIREYVKCDAEAMPFDDNRFDAVLSIRFLFHLPPETRRKAMKEMARVSRQWVIVDYRHKYTIKYMLKRLKANLGLTSKRYDRMSRREIEEDFREAGLEIVKIFPTFPLLSDKWVILGRKRDNVAAHR